jgi:DNA-binding PadR family transcriptional regulator|tara:strand:- start:6759 stop:7136 length:378 start_codon:yes stop_codon:yes gene_type:complete
MQKKNLNVTQKVLRFIKNEKPEHLHQVQSFVRAVSNAKSDSNEGFYSSNIKRLLDRGLINRIHTGKYIVTELGELYIEDRMAANRIIIQEHQKIKIKDACELLDKIKQQLIDGEYEEGDTITIKV